MYVPVVLLVGIERHWHAEDMADETVKAERHAGFATVAALFRAGSAGGTDVSADVTIVVGELVIVSVVVWYVCVSISAGGLMVAFTFLLVDVPFDCDRWRSGSHQYTNAVEQCHVFLTRRL